MNENVTNGLWPDLTLLIEVSVDAAAGRDGVSDRLEQEGAGFQEKVSAAYSELAERDPERIVVIDGSLPIQDVHTGVADVVKQRLEDRS